MSENMWKGWWRWPLVPVAVVLSLILVPFLFDSLTFFYKKMYGYDNPGWIQTYLSPAFRFGVIGYLTVIAGCYVAPRGKVVVGVIISTTIVLVSLFFWSKLISALPSVSDGDISTADLVWSGIYTIVFLGASILAIIHVNEEN